MVMEKAKTQFCNISKFLIILIYEFGLFTETGSSCSFFTICVLFVFYVCIANSGSIEISHK